MRAMLFAAGLVVVITAPAFADERNYTFYNDTSREITSMSISTNDDDFWHPVTGDVIKPHSSSYISFQGGGPCVIQIKIEFNDDPEQNAAWPDGFNLCRATSLHLYHGENGEYYIHVNY